MSDPFFDDVKELLDKGKGDERILKQIFRACENNEVISNYERNYVKKLAEKYLGRFPPDEKKISEKPEPPDVVLPEIPSIKKSQIVQNEPQIKTKSSSKKSNMMLVIGGAVLAIIVIVAVAFTSSSDVSSNSDPIKQLDTSTSSTLIEIDSSSYKTKDIISISGKVSTFGTVNLSIDNEDGKLVWSEQVTTKNDGRFSTLVIAGGPGWEKSGTYTINMQNNSEKESQKFSFTA